MSEWAARRFWERTEVVAQADGFGVTLDGRDVKTPAKLPLIVPSEAMAQAISLEWAAQEEKIDPLSMPVTRSANVAIDRVALQHAEVSEIIAAYGSSDLVCYRADGPEGLVQRQAEAWDPLVDWSSSTLGAPLVITHGVMPVEQSAATRARFLRDTSALDAFRLTAFHDLVSLSGSLVLGFAVIKGRLDAEEAWLVSRIDEFWQIEQWGDDEEASEQAELKRSAFLHADRFFRLCS